MFQIAFAWSPEVAAELEKQGFRKEEVYIKWFGGTKAQGDSEFFRMKPSPPYQFCTTDYWGAGAD